MKSERKADREQSLTRPGYGVDRSQIRRLLALTPAERLTLFVASAGNVLSMISNPGEKPRET